MKMHAWLGVLVLWGCGSSGGGGPDMSAVPKDLTVGSMADIAMIGNSCCGQPGDKGNSLGVGQFCNPDPCTGDKAIFCASLGGDDRQHFCTFPCSVPDGGMDPCGENAFCACRGGQCGCAPTSCMNEPDGC
jgi:hypothetical protein